MLLILFITSIFQKGYSSSLCPEADEMIDLSKNKHGYHLSDPQSPKHQTSNLLKSINNHELTDPFQKQILSSFSLPYQLHTLSLINTYFYTLITGYDASSY